MVAEFPLVEVAAGEERRSDAKGSWFSWRLVLVPLSELGPVSSRSSIEEDLLEAVAEMMDCIEKGVRGTDAIAAATD
jgi:hypothetical protein